MQTQQAVVKSAAVILRAANKLLDPAMVSVPSEWMKYCTDKTEMLGNASHKLMLMLSFKTKHLYVNKSLSRVHDESVNHEQTVWWWFVHYAKGHTEMDKLGISLSCIDCGGGGT